MGYPAPLWSKSCGFSNDAEPYDPKTTMGYPVPLWSKSCGFSYDSEPYDPETTMYSFYHL